MNKAHDAFDRSAKTKVNRGSRERLVGDETPQFVVHVDTVDGVPMLAEHFVTVESGNHLSLSIGGKDSELESVGGV